MAGFDVLERDQQGYATINGLFAIISAMRAAARPQEHRALLRRRGDSAGRAASVPRRHRRRQSRQRQHLHDGCRRPAHRERAGQDPRPGQPGRRTRRSRRYPPATCGGDAADEGAREQRGRAAPGSRTRARRARAGAPAACSSTTPTTCGRVSTAWKSDLRNYYLLGYTPTQRRLRRHVPQNRGQGEAAGCDGGGAQGLLRGARYRRRAGQRLGGAGAGGARPPARAERVSRARRRAAQFPSATAPASCRSSSI